MSGDRSYLRCPKCKGKLDVAPTALRCAACTVDYPVVDGIPVLLDEPRAYLARSLLGYEEVTTRWVERLKQLDSVAALPALEFRRPVFEALREGLQRNIALARGQQATLTESVRVEDLTREAARLARRPTGAGKEYTLVNALGYVLIDWGNTSEAEEHIQTVEQAVFPQIDRYCERGGEALFLGAGMGRYLVDAADRFARVLGVELAFPYLVNFAALRKGPLRYARIHMQNPTPTEQVVQDVNASMPEAARIDPRIEFIAADALRLPLADQSQSTVVSIFFADVLPLPQILKEVRRVLRPGGRFINFGPLNYHFSEVEAMFTPGEAQHVMRESGFRMEEQRWSRMASGENPGAAMRVHLDVWSYVLTKI